VKLLRSGARGTAPGLRGRRGFALESTLIVLLLMSALAVIAFAGVVTAIPTARRATRAGVPEFRRRRTRSIAEADSPGARSWPAIRRIMRGRPQIAVVQ